MSEMKRISPFIKEGVRPSIKERISPFFKNLNGACPEEKSVAGFGTPEASGTPNGGLNNYNNGACQAIPLSPGLPTFSTQPAYTMPPIYSYYNYNNGVYPDIYPSPGMQTCFMQPDYVVLPIISGSSDIPMDVKVIGVNDDGEEIVLVSSNNRNNRLADTQGQKNRTKKKGEESPRESLDEICERFMQRMFFLIQENKIEISNEKDLYKEETDHFYGHEKDGFIYLEPQRTYDFVVEDIQEEAGKHVPKSLELERYMYQKNILEREEGKKPNFQKKVTIQGKRMRCWCLKKDKMLEAMREYEEEHRDMAFDVEKSKK